MSKTIERGKYYRVVPIGDASRRYFLKKYGTATPVIWIEGTDHDLWGKSWEEMNGNPAALLFASRMGFDLIQFEMNSIVYGVKIGTRSELVDARELREAT